MRILIEYKNVTQINLKKYLIIIIINYQFKISVSHYILRCIN